MWSRHAGIREFTHTSYRVPVAASLSRERQEADPPSKARPGETARHGKRENAVLSVSLTPATGAEERDRWRTKEREEKQTYFRNSYRDSSPYTLYSSCVPRPIWY